MRPFLAWSLSGAQSLDGGGSKVCVGSHTTTNTTAKKTSTPPRPATQGVISIFSGGCGAHPFGDCAPAWSCPVSSAIAQLVAGGAITSASRSVSRLRRSWVFVIIVIPMLIIWTMPESTIIAPKTPRAM